MHDITQVVLPGVGVRHEFTLSSGQRIAVVSHRGGRREIALYRRDDPDSVATAIDLDPEDAATLSSVLGVPQMTAAAEAMQRIEGLALDWLTVEDSSPAAGATIAAGGYRSRTGASIVAVIRGRETVPAPEPSFALAPGDVAVAVGTPEGLEELRALLRG
jgi:TrkA domain protein